MFVWGSKRAHPHVGYDWKTRVAMYLHLFSWCCFLLCTMVNDHSLNHVLAKMFVILSNDLKQIND